MEYLSLSARAVVLVCCCDLAFASATPRCFASQSPLTISRASVSPPAPPPSPSPPPHKVLFKIIELQTHDPKQFEELGLPLNIKHLAWEKDAKLFMRVAAPHAENYIASEFVPKMVVASQQVCLHP